ncbi:2-oxoglutarate-dependent dioxygenase 19-like [Corylus avellana]|uniref:2-oxoglutarate-dependent dioxygenase 19-like n=1 Tax=Corylus avellana TaxID=13451 RepID=UPI00286B5444|nr:2-oxoglutarate-dependent dioxygenase 19-like [Corylus avellana]
MFSIKSQVESGCLTSVPPKYVFDKSSSNCISSEAETIPTIDVSLLTFGTPDQRSKVIQDIGNACRDWGFFMIINHGVPETLRDEMLKGCQSFFNLTEEEKKEFSGKQLFDPISYGTSFNTNIDTSFFWRDYLKVWVHPNLRAPHKPAGFSETVREYSKRTREVASELVRGISESLGLEERYIEKTYDLEVGSQLLVVNLYPPCPEPEVAIGLPPHTDHGILTLLMQNELSGLQVMHNGKWVPVNDPPPNSFLVNMGDHMEILTNGKYKSVVHRAVVNNKETRISLGTAYGPPLDTVVSPAPELVDCESYGSAYRGIKYRDYLVLQKANHLDSKSCLDRVRI